MFKEKRHDEVYKYILERNEATVEELSKTFGVSAMTIRRDLGVLERAGIISRTHGGAIASSYFTNEERYEQKQGKNIETKKRIAKNALRLIKETDIIFLDSGTTTYQLALLMKREFSGLTVLTNDLKIASELYETANDVLIFGGRIQRETGTIVGSVTNSFVDNVNIDICFIGAHAINNKLCLIAPSEEKAQTKAEFIKRSAMKVLLCDDSKFGINGLFTIVTADQFNYIVTDHDFTAAQKDTFTQSGVNLIAV